MYYSYDHSQFVEDGLPYHYGTGMLIGDSEIKAGTVLVLNVKKETFMFQTLSGIALERLRGASYIGFEPGSIVQYGVSGVSFERIRPLFKYVRYPTVSELSWYNTQRVV